MVASMDDAPSYEEGPITTFSSLNKTKSFAGILYRKKGEVIPPKQ